MLGSLPMSKRFYHLCLLVTTVLLFSIWCMWQMDNTEFKLDNTSFTTQQTPIYIPKLKLKTGEYVVINCSDKIPTTNYKFPVTLVTSYFRIKGSKHTDGEYDEWIRRFLRNVVETPVVIYTSPNMLNLLITMNGNHTGPKIFVICEDIWSPAWIKRPIPKIRNSSVQYPTWESAYKQQQHSIDREKHIYVADHYSIYNHKSFMVREVSIVDPFQSDYFFWVDIGSFRVNHVYKHWPSVAKLNCIFTKFPDRILYALHSEWPVSRAVEYKIESGPVDIIGDTVIGSIWGGKKSSVLWYQHTYELLHDTFYQAGQFVGKEQSNMNALSFKYFDKFVFIRSYNLPGPCEPRWWYFHNFLAETNETRPNCPTTPLIVPVSKHGNITTEEFAQC